MKKTFLGIIVFLFSININFSQAADLAGKWSLGISGGLGITIGPEDASDYFPTSFVISGDISYMLMENIGIIPAAFSYVKFNFDKDKLADDLGIPRSVMDEIDTSVWSLGFTPGVLFTTSGNNKVRAFGQVGAGIYHFKSSVEVPAADYKEEETENDFGMLLGGGLEADISKNAAFVGKARFHWIATEDESTTVFDIMGGIKFYF